MTAGSVTRADGQRHYIHPLTGERLVSVTTVLSSTSSRPHLVPWAARLAAEFAVDEMELVAKTLAAEGRDAAVNLVKDQARQLRERKADAGTYVHDVQEALILWAASPGRTGSDIALPVLPEHLEGADYDGEPLEDVVEWMVDGFLRFVSAFDPEFEAAEMTVYNRDLKVAGTLDMIFRLRGVALTPDGRLVAAPGGVLTLCSDTKTGKYLDNTVPEQLAAYRRMHEALMPMGEIAPMPATDAGAILHLRPEYEDGYRLIIISPQDDALAWNRFRRAVELAEGRSRVRRKPGKVAYPLREDGTMPPPRLADLDGEGYGRVLNALAAAGCVDLGDVAALTAADLLAIKGIGAKTQNTVRQMLADYGLHLADETPQPVEEVA